MIRDLTPADYSLRSSDNCFIVVEIDELLQAHEEDSPGYEINYQGHPNDLGRIPRAKRYLEAYFSTPLPELTLEASYVYVYAGRLSFTDGRHRLIALKELGATRAVIEVTKDNRSEVIARLDKVDTGL